MCGVPPYAVTTMNTHAEYPVWSKNSYGLARVVFQEPAEPLTTLNWTFALRVLAGRRKEQDIVLALMIPLVMKMCYMALTPHSCHQPPSHPG